MARRRSRQSRSKLFRPGLRTMVLLILALSLLEFVQTGSVQWPRELWSALHEPAGPTAAQVDDAADGLPAAGNTGAADAAAGSDSSVATRGPGRTGVVLISGQALRITDGDTFTLLPAGDAEPERVRLHGIDAPERDQPHGSAAGTALAELVEGHTLQVEVVERDNYGRLVGRVWIDDLDINLAMVTAGHAWWYEYYAQERRDLELAEEEARRARRGLWQQHDAIAPWDWRRAQR